MLAAPRAVADAGMAGVRRRSSGHALFAARRIINARTSRSSRWRGNGARTRTPLAAFGTRPGNFQNTPLMIDNVLYVSTPYNRVAALDAETGKELWSYDPKAYEDGQPPNGTGLRASRRGGVARSARGDCASS